MDASVGVGEANAGAEGEGGGVGASRVGVGGVGVEEQAVMRLANTREMIPRPPGRGFLDRDAASHASERAMRRSITRPHPRPLS